MNIWLIVLIVLSGVMLVSLLHDAVPAFCQFILSILVVLFNEDVSDMTNNMSIRDEIFWWFQVNETNDTINKINKVFKQKELR